MWTHGTLPPMQRSSTVRTPATSHMCISLPAGACSLLIKCCSRMYTMNVLFSFLRTSSVNCFPTGQNKIGKENHPNRESLGDGLPASTVFWVDGLLDTDQNHLTPLGCCLLYTSPSPRDKRQSRMPSSA